MSRAPRRFALAVGATIIAASVLTACSGTPETGGDSGDAGFGDLAIRLSWQKDVGAAGEYFADQNGYYEEAGFSSTELIAGGQSAPPVATDIVQGNVLYGIDSPDFVATAVIAGSPLTILGCQDQANPMAILSAADSGIASPEDLVGKRIGVQDANLTTMESVFAANDIDPSSVTVVPWQGDATILAGGEVDAVLAFGVEYTIALDNIGFDYRRDLLTSFGIHNMAYCFVASTETLENDREMLKAALLAEVKGWRDAYADPEQAVAYTMDEYGKDLGLDEDAQHVIHCANSELMLTDDTIANGLFTITEEQIDLQIQTLELGGITGVSADALFDTSLIDEIYDENPDLIAVDNNACEA